MIKYKGHIITTDYYDVNVYSISYCNSMKVWRRGYKTIKGAKAAITRARNNLKTIHSRLNNEGKS